MGGVFSGQRLSKKRVVDSCNAIDTADLNRWGLLKAGAHRSGSLHWRRGDEKEPYASVGYTLAVESGAGTLWLQYQTGQPVERFDYLVRLVTTGCHLGGVRWWFLCPLVRNNVPCGRRVRKLYLSGRYFGCRCCHNLTYRTQQESDSRVYALARAGLDAMPSIAGASVSQLGLALKALTLMEKRAKRFDI